MTERGCSIEGCDRRHMAKGWCNIHYKRWWKWGDPMQAGRVRVSNIGPCSVEGCDRDAQALGMCKMHYGRKQRTGDPLVARPHRRRVPCSRDGCTRQARQDGLCQKHWRHEVLGDSDEVPAWLDLADVLEVDVEDTSWLADRACGGEPKRTFFPPALPGGSFDFTPAAAVCRACPVRAQCLAWWLASEPEATDITSGGYVGGCTPRQRRVVRSELLQRRRSAA